MGYSLRLGLPPDGPAIAALFRRTRKAKLPYLPELHTPEEERQHFSVDVMAACTVWVAETDRVVGFIACRDGWVDHLYVDVDHLGRGIGSELLAKATASHSRLQLWAFQKNEPALAFYRFKGFRVVRTTNGAGNEEREPDVLLEWER